MTVAESLLLGAQKLHHLPTPALDCEVLLAFTLHTSRALLTAHPEQSLPDPSIYEKLLEQRASGIPVAYLTGEKEFFGRVFDVTSNVLIPRPDTETLVEAALKWIDTHNARIVCDHGTGSGCIAITLASERPMLHIIATDISQKALAVAATNAKRHDVASRITFQHLDFRTDPLPTCDLIVSNPPYLSATQTDPSIEHEPKAALFSNDHGTEHLQALIQRSATTPLLVEIDPRQESMIRDLATRHHKHVMFSSDLASRTRVAQLRACLKSRGTRTENFRF